MRSYGVMLMTGFLIGMWRIMRTCARRMQTEPEGSPRRISPDTILDVGIWVLLTGLIGARVLFVLLDLSSYVHQPAQMFKLWEGGLSLHGGLIGGIIAMLFICRKKRLSLAVVSDLSAIVFSIAYSFGRIGCLLNGCCYGAACALPWAVRFPSETGPGLTPPSHPIQGYAAIIHFGVFFWLNRWEKRPHRDSEMFWAYIVIYGVYRFAIEFLREGVTSTYLIPSLHLTDTHIISLVMIVAGAAGLRWVRRNRPAVQDRAFVSGLPAAGVPAA